MTATRTVAQKVGDWKIAYDVVRSELVPDEMRTILAEMKKVDGIEQFASYVALAGDVVASDGKAGLIAAMLTGSGLKSAPMDFDDPE